MEHNTIIFEGMCLIILDMYPALACTDMSPELAIMVRDAAIGRDIVQIPGLDKLFMTFNKSDIVGFEPQTCLKKVA